MYYFIINPASGSGRGRTVWKTVKLELDHLNIEYRHFLLHARGEGTKLAASISESGKPCTIVVVGGDGTINEVINGLSSFRHITFACIPTGSGNDFVRGLRLTRDPVEALHVILQPGEIRPVNVGKISCVISNDTSTVSKGDSSFHTTTPHMPDSVQHRNFIVSSGIGYDAAVCYNVERSCLKQMLNRFHSGKLVYLFTALWQLITMKRLDFKVAIDDTHTIICKKAYFAAAMNLPYEGGGFRFCPNALPDDDELEVIIADQIPRLFALCLLPLALKGKHVGHKGIHIIRCRKFEVESPSTLCVHTDGEVVGFTEKNIFALHEEKLAVIIR